MELPDSVPVTQDFSGPIPGPDVGPDPDLASELGREHMPEPQLKPEPEPGPGRPTSHAGIAAEIAAAQGKLDQLIAMFADKIQYDDQKEKAFSRLYDELDSFKRDFVDRRMKEAYTDLILLYDNIKNYTGDDDVMKEEGALARRYLGYVMEELTEVLARRGIEPIFAGPGVSPNAGSFDPQFQRAIRTVPAESRDEDGRVVRVVKDGFTKDGKVLRPQSVIVARWTEPPGPAGGGV
ncbi:MAG TPA: nucleotide exchange factor GrpE [Bacillota bacterium]|nr:nucleotide exchange factor GrpE [Bacillota bacterium]